MDKENIEIYTIEFYSASKNNNIMLFNGKWIELEIKTLSEIIQCYKDKYHVFSHLLKVGETKQKKIKVSLLFYI
jgi:hypothetical protein